MARVRKKKKILLFIWCTWDYIDPAQFVRIAWAIRVTREREREREKQWSGREENCRHNLTYKSYSKDHSKEPLEQLAEEDEEEKSHSLHSHNWADHEAHTAVASHGFTRSELEYSRVLEQLQLLATRVKKRSTGDVTCEERSGVIKSFLQRVFAADWPTGGLLFHPLCLSLLLFRLLLLSFSDTLPFSSSLFLSHSAIG